MNKEQKNKIDSNAKKLLEEAKIQNKLDPEELKEGEYIVCPGCGEKMPKTISTCVTCGVKLKNSSYTPISDKKAAKIRWIVGIVSLIAFFIIWFFVLD